MSYIVELLLQHLPTCYLFRWAIVRICDFFTKSLHKFYISVKLGATHSHEEKLARQFEKTLHLKANPGM